MSTIGNVLQKCAQPRKNTGYNLSCFTEFGAPIGIILAQYGQTIPTSSIAAAKTAISGFLLNSDPNQRFYPIQSPIDPKDNSEAPVVVTSTLGQKKKIRDGFTDLTLQWWDGGMCLLIPLRLMNGIKMPFYILTSYGFLVGTNKGDGLCSPITPTLFDAEPFKWSAGNDANAYMIHTVFDPAQTNENVMFIDFNGAGGGLPYLQGLIGLENIVITKQARVVALITVGLSTSCGGVDLFQTYPTQFVVGLWKAYADTGGVADLSKPIAITSATPTADGYALQITVADANYTAGAPIWIGLTNPQALLTAGIGGVDGSTGFEAQLVSIGL
jgi:hypothetical protein